MTLHESRDDRRGPGPPHLRAEPRRGLRHPLRRRPALPVAAVLGGEPGRPGRDRASTPGGCPPQSRLPQTALALIMGGAVGQPDRPRAPGLRDRLRGRVLGPPPLAGLQRRRLRDLASASCLLVLDILRTPADGRARPRPRRRAAGGGTASRAMYPAPLHPPRLRPARTPHRSPHAPHLRRPARHRLPGRALGGRPAGRSAGLDAARVTDMAVYVLIAGLVGPSSCSWSWSGTTTRSNPRELLLARAERRRLLRRPARRLPGGLVVRAAARARRLAHRGRARARRRHRPGHRPAGLLRRRLLLRQARRACPGP